MAEVASGYVTLIPSAKGFGKAIDNQIGGDLSKSGKTGGKRFGAGAVGAIGGIIKTGVLGVGGAAAGVLGTALFKGFNRLSAIEEAQAKLKGLGNSAKTVDKIMANALAAVKGTAFGLDEAATVAAGAVASGVKPGKDLQRTLGLVADAATIGGTSMGEMGAIFNKVAASGKIQGDVIAQLGDKGIPILQLLGKQLHKTPAEVAKMASKGKIGFETFQKAMQAGLGGAALKSGQTTKGALKNMGAALSRFGASLLKGIFPLAKRVFGGITKFLDDATKAVGPFAEKFSELAGKGLTALIKGVQKLAPAFSFIKEALNVFFTALGNGEVTAVGPLGKIGDAAYAIRDAITVAIPVVQRIFTNVVGYIKTNVVPAFMGIVTAVQGYISVALPIMQAFVSGMMTRLQPMLPTIKGIFSTIGQIVTGAMALISAVITAVTAVIGFIWSRWGSNIMDFTAKIFGAIFNIIGGALKIISGIIKVVTSLIKGDWSGAWAGIKQIVAGAWQVIKGVVSAALTVLKALFSAAGAGLKAAMSGVWSLVKSAVSSGVSGVVGLVKALPGKIIGALGDLGHLLYDAGAKLIQGLADGIKSRIKAVTDAVGSVAQKVKDFFPGSPVKTGPLTAWNNGGAGKRLGNMLADGLDASRRTVAAASSGLAASVASPSAGVGSPAMAGAGGGSQISVYTNDPLEAAHAIDRRQNFKAMSGAFG